MVVFDDNDRFLQLRASIVLLCGDLAAATVLSFLITWHNFKSKNSSSKALVMNFTAEQIERGIYNLFKRDRIRSGVEILKRKGFISETSNPKRKGDRTKFFIVNEGTINAKLRRVQFTDDGRAVWGKKSISLVLKMQPVA